MVHLSVIRILRLRSASEISIAGLVGFRFLLDSGLHVADAVTEAPAAARDVDDAAPLVAAEGRWAATWADFRSSLADASAILAVLQVGEWPPVHTLGASSRG